MGLTGVEFSRSSSGLVKTSEHTNKSLNNPNTPLLPYSAAL